MKVTVLLADAAQSDPTGKTHVLGLGWTAIDAPTTHPIAVLVLVTFEGREEAGTAPHEVTLRLNAGDGTPFELPDTGQPLVLTAGLELEAHSDGMSDGPVTAPFAVNIGPGLPLEPGQQYRWEAEVDGRADQRADVAFATRAVSTPPADDGSG